MTTGEALTTGLLDVPGARLHYEVRGEGPPLLLLCGGMSDAGSFMCVADALARHYTVLSFDPRGNSRSPLLETPHEQAVEERTDDAVRVLNVVTDAPALVFGSSSGAVTLLDLLARHPERVRFAVAHEPPSVEVLPNAAEHRAFFDAVYATNRRHGGVAAMAQFGNGIGLPPDDALDLSTAPPEISAMLQRMQGNRAFFFEREMRPVTRYVPDLAALTEHADRLILGIGRESLGYLPAFPASVIARQVGAPVVEFPGGHAGYLEDAAGFSTRLLDVLALAT